jgi:formate dehydrogenase major subunit
MLASTAVPGRAATIMYALGWTQHSTGSQTIRAGAMVQLLLGNIGIAGGGMNALRGHSNIQGLTDLGLLSNHAARLPDPAGRSRAGLRGLRRQARAEAAAPEPAELLAATTKKFHVSFMKAWWGDAATAENNWAYDYLPKLDKPYDMLQTFELMNQGKVNGYLCQGFNILASAPTSRRCAPKRCPG